MTITTREDKEKFYNALPQPVQSNIFSAIFWHKIFYIRMGLSKIYPETRYG